MSLLPILFPDPPRELPAERAIRMSLRTAHIAATGILLGGHCFGVAPDRLIPWLWPAILSGAAFVAVELYGSCAWFFETRGVLVALKWLLLLLVPIFWEARVWLLLTILAIGSVGSHMPGRFRYYSLLQHRSSGHERKG
ncbi:MAG: hypothetical protein HY360_11940 [Verrucomicrobia bacterium]|nr:hypothetical protein [Verrucomicrobiota bacterium]